MKRALGDCPHGARNLPASRRTFFFGGRSAFAKRACEECGERDELRVCQSCGHVACCESHRGHDTDHFEKTSHCFIRPRTGADWLWCYGCRAYLE